LIGFEIHCLASYVKILDFWLAKLTASGIGSDSNGSQAPTAFAQTESGIILGTVGLHCQEAPGFRNDGILRRRRALLPYYVEATGQMGRNVRKANCVFCTAKDQSQNLIR